MIDHARAMRSADVTLHVLLEPIGTAELFMCCKVHECCVVEMMLGHMIRQFNVDIR